MLVLSRKSGEKIHVGPDITITVVQVQGNKARIGIDAPPDVRICRKEILRAREILCGSSEETTVGENDKPEEQLPEELRILCAGLSRVEQPEALRQQAKEITRRRSAFTPSWEGGAAMRMLDLVDSSADAIISETLDGNIVSWPPTWRGRRTDGDHESRQARGPHGGA